MAVEFVYGNNPLFRQYRWENFKTNYKNLRDALNREIDRAIEDEGNLAKDKPHHVVVNSSSVAGVAKMFTMDLMKVALEQAFWFGGLDQGVPQAPATTDSLLDKNI